MVQDLQQILRTLRNEMVHGQQHPSEFLGERLQELGVMVRTDDLQGFVADLLRSFADTGEHFVPSFLLKVISSLLEGYRADIACDPWAGFGVLAATVHDVVQPRKTIAFSRNSKIADLAKVLTPELEWKTGDPLAFLEALTDPLDVITSVLPFGARASEEVDLQGESGDAVSSNRDLGQILLAATSLRLSTDGLGLFVVPPGFFFKQRSILHQLPHLNISVEAALELPSGSFAPYTNIASYLIVVKKRESSGSMFVAQLSQDSSTNQQIVANFRKQKPGAIMELGRFVPRQNFRGLNSLRLDEMLRKAEVVLKTRSVRLGDLSNAVQLGRRGDDIAFQMEDNAIFIPLIGTSDVVDSIDAMTLKGHNYGQVVVDPARSISRFVAQFLNTELGQAIREGHKSGTTIRKLNKSGLKELQIFVPTLSAQWKILETEARLIAVQNTLSGLANDLSVLHRELWSDFNQRDEVDLRLQEFTRRFADSATPYVAVTLEEWFETLPFPLASILRAWQATPSRDSKLKYEHLLHFFEATTQFLSIIFLSAFSSQREFFAVHREVYLKALRKQHLSLERATFGTWKVAIEYFSKQTRLLLEGGKEEHDLCSQLFADETLMLPRLLASRGFASIFSMTIRMRNDWTGHGGVVSKPESNIRNPMLLAEIQNLREAMGGGWEHLALIRADHTIARKGMFENEVAILVGSNSEFLKETRLMATWLDVERLYMAAKGSDRGLLLLPLMQLGPSPSSAENAIYFYSRLENDKGRFVSFHHREQPVIEEQSEILSDAIRLLSETSIGDAH